MNGRVKHDNTADIGPDLKLSCGRCGISTNHQRIHTLSWDNDEKDWYEGKDYSITKCEVCGEIGLCYREWNEDSRDPITGDIDPNDIVRLLPARIPNRKHYRHYHSLPFHVQVAYRETVAAISFELTTLGAIGIRLIIEAVCFVQNAHGNNLATKIDDLCTRGLITKHMSDHLHHMRVVCNDSTHEMRPHGLRELCGELDVIESFLTSIYANHEIAASLPRKV